MDAATPAIGCPEGEAPSADGGADAAPAALRFLQDAAEPAPPQPTIVAVMPLARYGYLGCAGLSLFIFVLVKYYSGNFLPGEFGKLGRIKNCGGCCLRMFIQLLTFAHWIVLLPNLIFLMTYFTASECYMQKMGTQSFILFLVPLIWTV